MPTELDEIRRKILQHEIEETVLKKETDKLAVEHLHEVQKELSEMREQFNEMKAKWENEKSAISKVQKLREDIEQCSKDIERAEREYDLNKLAELKYGRMADLQKQLAEEEEKAEAAKEYCEKVEDQIEEKTKDLTDDEKKNVFFLFNYSDTALVTSGKNFWGQYWCDAINAVNVGEEIEAERSNASVNMEQVYSWDPDIIFISNFTKAMPEDLYNNTIGDNDWSSVSAVKEEQVYKMPLGAYRSFTPGADTPMTLMWLAKTVYPDLFEDVDMTDEVQNYYDEVYGIELTDEQVAQMYTPSTDAANGYGISK